MPAVALCVAVPFVKLNGQFTPPWPTSPFALHASELPESVPVPDPVTAMLPPQVPANVTFADDELTGVTV